MVNNLEKNLDAASNTGTLKIENIYGCSSNSNTGI